MTERPGQLERARRPIAKRHRDSFLASLREGYSVTHAAVAAGKVRQRFYEERAADEAFAAAWDDAFEAGTDALEDELRRRGLEGYDEETFNGAGELTRRVRRFSDNALVTALKARRPELYRETARVDVRGAVDVQLEGHQPTTLRDIVALALDLEAQGMLGNLGLRELFAPIVEGDVLDEALAELSPAPDADDGRDRPREEEG